MLQFFSDNNYMKESKRLYFLLAIVSILMSSSLKSHEKYITNKSLDAAFNSPAKYVLLHEVPVLCYHQIRDWKKTDSKNARTYIIPPAVFQKQIKMLVDSGYHFILPAQLLAYNTTKGTLPQKSIMLTFDDGTLTQYTEALPLLNRYGIKAVFFVMTVVLNHQKYLSSQQVKTLADQGHIIGCHTWDHHNVTNYKEDDWKIQIEKPTDQLKKITGKPIEYFAYPNGIWNPQAIDKLKKNGFLGAFQLAAKQDLNNPRFTLRRIIGDGTKNQRQLLNAIKYSFK